MEWRARPAAARAISGRPWLACPLWGPSGAAEARRSRAAPQAPSRATPQAPWTGEGSPVRCAPQPAEAGPAAGDWPDTTDAERGGSGGDLPRDRAGPARGGDRGPDRAGPERGQPGDRPPRRPGPLPGQPGHPGGRPGAAAAQDPQARRPPRAARAVLHRLRAGWSPDQIAGRLRHEQPGAQAGRVAGPISHEAIYTWLYALPKGELARQGILLRSGRTQRRPRRRATTPGARIVGMRCIDDRPAEVANRRVPGHWEGDLMIGRAGRSAMATLVERTSRYTVPVALPAGRRDATTTCDALIDAVAGMPTQLTKTLTWDQGSEMAAHAAFSLATNVEVYFAHPHSPWERGTNENTNRLLREYFPKGTDITDDQNLSRPRRPRTQQPTTPYTRLPNPSRSLHRPPGQRNCFDQLIMPFAGRLTASETTRRWRLATAEVPGRTTGPHHHRYRRECHRAHVETPRRFHVPPRFGDLATSLTPAASGRRPQALATWQAPVAATGPAPVSSTGCRVLPPQQYRWDR